MIIKQITLVGFGVLVLWWQNFHFSNLTYIEQKISLINLIN